MNEFQLIAHFFAEQNPIKRSDVLLGIGDDCAIVTMPRDQQMLISMDTLVSGVHFPESTSPYDIGYKALAVNLSDLAAMGAEPAWFSLALTLPAVDEGWLAAFSRGLFDLAQQFNVQLVGGDTTRGPLSITIQVHGFAPKDKAVRRQGAQAGDLIYVTNNIGDAGLALQHIQGTIQLPSDVFAKTASQLNRPFPRVREGLLFRDYATSMIDLSDGLAADLGHILRQSNVGAAINTKKLPLSFELARSLSPLSAVRLALTAGDDYELCCTIPCHKKESFEALLQKNGCVAQHVGFITESRQLQIIHEDEYLDDRFLGGYAHFV